MKRNSRFPHVSVCVATVARTRPDAVMGTSQRKRQCTASQPRSYQGAAAGGQGPQPAHAAELVRPGEGHGSERIVGTRQKEEHGVKEKVWPNLAKMVKQYFAQPASLAGIERVFSAAGKMHDDLRKSAKDDTLEHARSSWPSIRTTLSQGCTWLGVAGVGGSEGGEGGDGAAARVGGEGGAGGGERLGIAHCWLGPWVPGTGARLGANSGFRPKCVVPDSEPVNS